MLRWVLSFAEPFVLSFSLDHLHVLLSALSHTMSELPIAETLSLKTLAFAFAFQSMKVGLIIAKCFSCLIVIVMLGAVGRNTVANQLDL